METQRQGAAQSVLGTSRLVDGPGDVGRSDETYAGNDRGSEKGRAENRERGQSTEVRSDGERGLTEGCRS